MKKEQKNKKEQYANKTLFTILFFRSYLSSMSFLLLSRLLTLQFITEGIKLDNLK